MDLYVKGFRVDFNFPDSGVRIHGVNNWFSVIEVDGYVSFVLFQFCHEKDIVVYIIDIIMWKLL